VIKEKVKIANKLGIHARPAALIAKTAGEYKSEIKIEKDGVEINAKSIMGIMMLAAEYNSTITITARGSDEKEAVKKLKEVLRKSEQ